MGMSDLKLFRIVDSRAEELRGSAVELAELRKVVYP